MKLIAIYIVIFYILLLVIAYFFSDSMIFLPPRAHYENSSELIQLKTTDGVTIFAYYLPNKDAKYTLLVSHGNAEDLGNMFNFLHEMHNHGFAVFAYDYHGYGLSGGKPTEHNVYLDIDAAYNYLTQDLQIAPKNIIVYGHSVGGAIALDLAVRKPIAAVIIQGPFVTAFRVMTRIPLLPFDKFDNLKKITLLKSPLLIIHGTADGIIPFWHAQKLYDAATVPKQLYAIKNAGHNNLLIVAGEEYWQTINNFIQKFVVKHESEK